MNWNCGNISIKILGSLSHRVLPSLACLFLVLQLFLWCPVSLLAKIRLKSQKMKRDLVKYLGREIWSVKKSVTKTKLAKILVKPYKVMLGGEFNKHNYVCCLSQLSRNNILILFFFLCWGQNENFPNIFILIQSKGFVLFLNIKEYLKY